MRINKETLDTTAKQYHQQDAWEDKHIEAAAQRYTFGWVFSHIPEGAKVLEMGYGDGLFSEALYSRKISFSVVEGAKTLVDVLATKYPEVGVSHALFETFFPDEKFDVVLATHVLEHVENPVALLTHMRNWLKPGGRIIIIVPNKESLHRKLAVLMGLQAELDSLGARDHLVGHLRVYSLETLEKDIEAAGYGVFNKTGFFLKTLPNSMMREFSPELIQALNEISPELPAHLLGNIGIVATLK